MFSLPLLISHHEERSLPSKDKELRRGIEKLHHIAEIEYLFYWVGVPLEDCVEYISLSDLFGTENDPRPGGYLTLFSRAPNVLRFHDMEKCDNRVVADRLTILSNISQHEDRLTRTSVSSYSLATLKLICQNSRLPSIFILEANAAPLGSHWTGRVTVEFLCKNARALMAHMKIRRTEWDVLINVLKEHLLISDADLPALESFEGVLKIIESRERSLTPAERVMKNVFQVYGFPLDCTIGEIIDGDSR